MLTPTPHRLLCSLSSDTDDHPTRLPCSRRLHIACSAPCPSTPTTTRRGYHAHADATSPALLPLLRHRRPPDEATMLTPTPHRLLCYLFSDTDDHPTRLPCSRRLHIACSATSLPTPTTTRRGCHAHADSTSPALLPLLRHRRPPDEATMLTPTPHRLLCYLFSDTDDHPTRLPCSRRLHIACSAPCPPTPTTTR